MTAPTIISTWKAGRWMTMGTLCSSMSTAKLVRWSHSHTVTLVLVSTTLHPAPDQVEVSRLQNTQTGLPMPSSRRCLRLTLTGAAWGGRGELEGVTPHEAGGEHATVEDLAGEPTGAVEAARGHSLTAREDLVQVLEGEEHSLDQLVPGVPLEGRGRQEDAVLNGSKRLLVIVRWKA